MTSAREIITEYVALADAANSAPASELLAAVPLKRVQANLRRARDLLAVPPLEEIRQLLDRAAEIADGLTNAEPDHRHASRLSRISDGLDLARERLADCEPAACGNNSTNS